jgi:hypothetical protein
MIVDKQQDDKYDDVEFLKSYNYYSKKSLNDYIENLLNKSRFEGLFIACIFILQDLKEDLEQCFNKTFENDEELTHFIKDLKILKIISDDEFNSFYKFKKFRDILIHQILKIIRKDHDSAEISLKDQYSKITDFINKKYQIYNSLLKYHFNKNEILSNKGTLRLLIELSMFEKKEEVLQIMLKSNPANLFQKYQKFLKEYAVKFKSTT